MNAHRCWLLVCGTLLVWCAPAIAAEEPQVLVLWPAGAPGALGNEAKDKPTLTVYLPEKEKGTGAAIVICPGGGYGHVAIDHEGHQIARWLNSVGVAGIILDYRHRSKGYGHPAPLQDAQRAVRTARAKAGEWGIDPQRVGILGFSAGGHLASTVLTHFDAGNAQSDDPVEKESCRPDFGVLCYPVVAFDEAYTHRGSQTNLLGKDASPELIRQFSNEKQVTKETPPTFLWHTNEDSGVPAENSVMFYLALRKAGVPAELHIYEKGRHGIGLGRDVPGAQTWSVQCENWLQVRGLLQKP